TSAGWRWPRAAATPVPTSAPRDRASMTAHRTGTRDQWQSARLDLLKAEKELTRLNDDIARQRRDLPWVRIDKDYRFDTEDGEATLARSEERRVGKERRSR